MLVVIEKNAAADRAEVIGELTTAVHEAATEAAVAGYPRIARLLDECGFALASCAPPKKSAVEGRARKALTVWTTLRSF